MVLVSFGMLKEYRTGQPGVIELGASALR